MNTNAFRLSLALAALVFLATTTAQAGVPAQQRYGFNALAMPGPAVGIGVRPVLSKDLPEGDPLRVGWERFVQETGGSWRVWLDLRSGLPALVEGSGIWWFDPDGPTPDLGDLAAKARAFLAQHSGLLGSWDEQLVFDAAASATREGGGGALFFGQAVKGVPVEGAHFVFRLSRGAVVAFGAVHWAAPHRPFVAAIGVDEARNALRAHLGLSATEPLRELGTATLRILPADPEQGGARAWTGRRGEGYAHKLVWRIRIEESAGGPTWLADVDAETAAVVAFLPERMDSRISGGIFPLAPDGRGWEGSMQPLFPLPYGSVYENGIPVARSSDQGLFDCPAPGALVTFGMSGPMVNVIDGCGPASESAICDGNIDTLEAPDTNCSTPGGHSAGDTNPSRNAYYHVNRAKEQVAGWLPGNTWLSQPLNVYVNQTPGPDDHCNAYGGNALAFFVAEPSCPTNLADVQGILYHEFGHAFDLNGDGTGWTSPGEAYADVVAIFGARQSCVGRGARASNCGGYGDTCLDCTGFRDQDWDRHASHTPVDRNWVVTHCGTGPWLGPCGGEVHCEGHLAAQAVYDLAARDLPAMGIDKATSWQIAERLFYESRVGAGGNAYECTGAGTSGCSVNSWFVQMRAEDDDNGDLSDGTPHAAALFAAFARHGIACGSAGDLANQNYTICPPLTAPDISLGWNATDVLISWDPVPNATRYNVYRSDLSCDMAPVFIGSAGGSYRVYEDHFVSQDIDLYYRVQVSGENNKCRGPLSGCRVRWDSDLDRWGDRADCSDHDDSSFPGAPEVCDGNDNDCNGMTLAAESDRDRDGWVECAPWDDYQQDNPDIAGGGDCNDMDDVMHPGAPEYCDGDDDDCNGVVPDAERDLDGDGWAACSPWDDYQRNNYNIVGGGDCNDGDPAINPTVSDTSCNGVDENCSGVADEGYVPHEVTCGLGECAGTGATYCLEGREGRNCEIGLPTPEVCDGNDNDCDGTVPAVEMDHDSDAWVECAGWSDPLGRHPEIAGGGDCDDTDPSRSPGALELCNWRDDDCDGQIDDGVDLDADGFTTPCDCNDSDAATHPNADEICNHLDENCNGEPDDGLPWGPVLREVNGTGNFGHSVADVGDVDGDGRPDFVVGSPTESPGGRVRLFSGASRELLCETPDPAQAGGGIGTAVIGLPDLDGDRMPDFAASAPRADRNPPLEVDNGAVVVFSGRDCQPIRTCWPGAAGERAGDRSGLAAYGSDILVGLPFHDEPGAAEAGGVVIVSSRNCSVSGVLTGGTAANPRDHLGWSVASVPSVDHDGVLDIVAGAPHADAGGTDRGEVLVFSGADGRLLHRLSDVVGNDGALFGHAVVGIGDVNADGAGDIGIGEPKAGVGTLSSAGRALVFSGRTAARLASFDGQAQGDQLGYALAVMPARPGNHDHTLLAGAPYVDHASGAADAGRVVAILALDGSFLGSVERAQPGPGEHLGFSVSDLGDALGLGSQQLLGGAPGVNTALIIGVQSDCDGDGQPPAGGDCDDTDPGRFSGAVEVCDLVDNDCDATVDDGAGPPGVARGLRFTDRITLAWPQHPGADVYDVVEGDLFVLRASGGDFTPSVTGCLADGTTALEVQVPAVPAPGGGAYYLHRAIGCGNQNGTYDSGSPGQQGSRDGEVGQSPAACP